MKIMVYDRDISLHLLRFAGVGDYYAQRLVFFQALGDSQAVRGMKYILTRRQRSHVFSIFAHMNLIARPAYGRWLVETKATQVQGVTLHLLTAYLPLGTWPGSDERYFFVAPGEPGPRHDNLLRRWAHEFTPYPIPPTLSISSLLEMARTPYGDGYVFDDEGAPVLVGRGEGAWALAVQPRAFEEILKEVSHAS